MNTTLSITDQDIAELVSRNEQRLKQAKQKLGERWLLHPSNKVLHKDDPLHPRNAKSSPPRCILK